MPMNPRLLRPTASGFTPRSISGLALWLDGSDGATLFQNSDGTVPATASSDPVGYWADKSGNGRHAVMSVSANRPTVGSSSTAGKNAVRNNGTGTVALQVAAWPYTAGNTQFAVFNASALNQAVAQRGTLNDEPRFAIQIIGGVVSVCATRGGASAAQTTSAVGYPTSQWAIGATLFNTALGRAYRDGVYGADTTDSQTFSGDQELRLLSLPSNIYGINGGIAEFLHYDRQLTATEVSRVAAYLSRRWGITLAPQVSNADAQNWIDRVYQNGGTVSSATAAAVNTFCDAIDAAAIRDRFYRLNLFAGNSDASLNAVRTPLFRGPSLGGTQYGGTTDTNANFVAGDYSETSGLTGNGSTKYLNTGLAPNALPSLATGHLAVYRAAGTNANQTMIAARSGTDYYELLKRGDSRHHSAWGQTSLAVASGSEPSHEDAGLRLASRTSATMLRMYQNATVVADQTTSVTPAATDRTWFVFAMNQGTIANYWGNATPSLAIPLKGYSIGSGLTDAEVTAYTNAMNAFQTALGRA